MSSTTGNQYASAGGPLSPFPSLEDLDFGAGGLKTYVDGIVHQWLLTLSMLGFTLVPLFFVLDFFTMPAESAVLLPRFALYRLTSTLLSVIQYFIVRNTKPGRFSFLHGYLITIHVGGSIALMTVHLGGFNSSYYAGLNLLIVGVNLLLAWKPIHSALNSLLVVLMYVVFNLVWRQSYAPAALINNLFFMCSTGIVAVSITHLKYRLVQQEFSLLGALKQARDALWSEMELAKRIQTALLPERVTVRGFEIAATMTPAREVGGDYYDIVETADGQRWIAMGDVSGHGVDSGLIMIMAQTAIMSSVSDCNGCRPSAVLSSVNRVMRQNLARLGSDHYMTMAVLRLDDDRVTVAGRHQDILVFRADRQRIETVKTAGTWLGIADDISLNTEDTVFAVDHGDIMLLFTDGITEIPNARGEMYGQRRLERSLDRHADLPVSDMLSRIMEDVNAYKAVQLDDLTAVVVKRT